MSRPGSDGIRARFVLVLIYFALTIVPAKIPTPERVLEPPHAVVVPWGCPPTDLDELIAALAFG